MDKRLKILVTGANGQLGHKISQLLAADCQLILTDVDTLDITNKSAVFDFIKAKKPDYIIHGAAYTKVDLAEEQQELCRRINAIGTKNIAGAAKENNSTLFYISTDYVFDGKKKAPYTEKDKPNPLSIYGQTKLEGENFVKEICDAYYIFRISWLFGELPENYPGSNFIETMLRLAQEKDSLNIVNDQMGSPTYTQDLIETINKIISLKSSVVSRQNTLGSRLKTEDSGLVPYGIYHFSGNGECSWYDFATEIFKIAKIDIKVNPITSDQFPQKAKRPAYSYLSKDKVEKALDISVRNWQEMLNNYLANRSKNG